MISLLLLSTFDIENKDLVLENCKSQYNIFLYFINKYFKKYKYKPFFINNKIKSNLVKNFKENTNKILKWTQQNTFLKYDKNKFKIL